MSKKVAAISVDTYDTYELPGAFVCPECGNLLELVVEEYDLPSGEIKNCEDNFVECTYDTALEELTHLYKPEVWHSVTKAAMEWACQSLYVSPSGCIKLKK